MTRQDSDEWVFSEAGAPYLAEHRPFDEAEDGAFPNERPLFSDLTIDREAFRSAAIAWGIDGNSFAVWNADWAGLNQASDDGTYPDPTRIYFGHATDAGGLKQDHALDRDDLPDGWRVVDVKVSPTGQDLVVMVAAPLAGDLSTPTAELWLVRRNTGDVRRRVRAPEVGRGHLVRARRVRRLRRGRSGDRDAVAHRVFFAPAL